MNMRLHGSVLVIKRQGAVHPDSEIAAEASVIGTKASTVIRAYDSN